MPITKDIFPEIAQTIEGLNIQTIADERRVVLQTLTDYIQSKIAKDEEVRLNFICTHNSRRSHLSQVWAQTMAHYFNLQNVYCYSAGTEATALFPMVAETLQNSGFQISILAETNNPIYCIKYADSEHPVIGFSKKLNNHFNPKSNFVAIMTCSQAYEGCPFVPGAEARIPITYEDPKAFDDIPQQAEKYKERSLQIATEMKCVFSNV